MILSIIIPAYNEEKLLPATLKELDRACRSLRSRDWEHEIIVCDNNSTDRTAEIATTAGARVVFEPVNQISRARNAGAAAAIGDWLVFLDADTHPNEGLFADLTDAIQSGGVIGVGSTIRLDEPLRWAGGLVRGWNCLSRMTRWAAGSFVFCQAAAFRAVGGFSLDLYVSEELDLSRKLKRLGRRTGRRMVILSRHPLVTSARKCHLYSTREYLRFLRRLIMNPMRAKRDRDMCAPWYDGRR
jgi:glycosyltransferase involved in cell wall biosynthesis